MSFGKRAGGGRRIAPRLPAEVPARILGLNSSETRILVDVSSTGAKLNGADFFGGERDVRLKVGLVHVLATVVWSDGNQCGLTFDEPLSPLQVHQLHREGDRARVLRITPEERLAAEDWCNGLAR
jgi:hypothetical protein